MEHLWSRAKMIIMQTLLNMWNLEKNGWKGMVGINVNMNIIKYGWTIIQKECKEK